MISGQFCTLAMSTNKPVWMRMMMMVLIHETVVAVDNQCYTKAGVPKAWEYPTPKQAGALLASSSS